jgi:hypothetical protein
MAPVAGVILGLSRKCMYPHLDNKTFLWCDQIRRLTVTLYSIFQLLWYAKQFPRYDGNKGREMVWHMKCRGICYRFVAKKPSHGYRYAVGQRPCTVCNIFIDAKGIDTVRCPCCNNKLRISSRNKRCRKLRELYNIYTINQIPPEKLAQLMSQRKLMRSPRNQQRRQRYGVEVDSRGRSTTTTTTIRQHTDNHPKP